MNVDPHGLVWLDNPLLVLGLLSLIWVVVATLHAEPWARADHDDGGPGTATPRTDAPPVYHIERVSPLARRPHQPTAHRAEKARRLQAYRVTTARR